MILWLKICFIDIIVILKEFYLFMSKIIILSVDKKDQKNIELELLKSKILYTNPAIIPDEYIGLYCVQLLNVQPSYRCRNMYEIINGNNERKGFLSFIYFLKNNLLTIANEIHLCIQWDGDENEEINDIYEQRKINLFSFEFPEDEFEFEFNVDYIFVYEE